ncbi:MAG TPA: hypothetical protein DEB30_05495 [Candidatus Peribacter riflensis]|uniref:Uncharacterized protein n=1 Tax=Candidatus Peribacter riflensis TaxID=1735162 RepID=A0A0S1SGZ7_9BACT|nr:MAG: hypothetical protein PeribacterA2_0097 [Candidatus Peribacter riflensis]OGJ78652.1 MAG: hypothetical protein A2398_02165 [Candidatus Peribacteria bacterium RIFOXYB1_FULL_57_12]OGJ78759.1 MAG: hypothetical protein A2412_02235 [Candidatus Peribacteria bacterium RIFOXYC1_FULL_58_8]ALM10595.1 MAG: hypothetical protein PeribacterB2_0097 [Candidatus Peribacter riflensis]ALM11697.1 MAG: hypothetical protein PeribacterC2_0096 [Candidatus Peribacter riflensis]
MRKLLLVLGIVAALPVIGIVLLIGRGLVLQMIGYPVDISPSELAQAIASEKGDPTRCRKLQQTMPTMGPSLAEKRRLCIYIYAKLTHDPSACELLMPSSYGWSCLGAATDKQPCLFDFKEPPEVRGNGIIAPLAQCVHGDAATQNNTCCAVARIAFYDEKKDCSSLVATRDFIDQCYHEVAKKKINMEACSKIENANIRSACLVGVRALVRK